MQRPLIYLDNAATSWPKPSVVGSSMASFLDSAAGNPGRGGHYLARAAAEPPETVRNALAGMVNSPSPERVVLTHGCTDSVNIAIHGVLAGAIRCSSVHRPHVVTSSVEHNAVLRTIQCYVETDRIDLTVVGCDSTGTTDREEFASALREETVLACLSHASNAAGTIQPVRSVGEAVRRRTRRGLLLVDAAQTIGHIGIDIQADCVDLLTIAGHKGLLGPTGTGALVVGDRAWPDDPAARTFLCERRGGTGAAGIGMQMPDTLPDALEAGTSNAVGFAGLAAAIGHEMPDRHRREEALTERLLEGLGALPGVELYGMPSTAGRTAVVLFNVAGYHSREIGLVLDDQHGICARGGTHCAPLLHAAIGTGDRGAVRVSPGWATTDDEIDALLRAVEQLSTTRT